MRVLFIFLLICGCTAVLSGQPSGKGPILFTLANEEVTEAEFLYAYKKNHTAPQDYTEKSITDYLQLYINFKLKVKEARTRGLDTAKAYQSELKSYKEELKKPYMPSEHSLDFLVKETYARLTEEVRASHVLIKLAENATPADTLKAYQRALEIKSELATGMNFGLAARTYSDDPTARSNGGDLGFFTAMQMVYAFESAAYRTPVGKISDPVRTRFGYHLIEVTDRQPARGEVEVSHLMIRTSQTRSEKEARNLIFELYDQLKGGVDWNELVSQYSDDPGSKPSGGRLQPFGVGQMARLPEFEKAAFALQNPGEISDPVASPYGWHILRLEKKIPLPPLSEMEPALRRQVARNERYQISREKHLKDLKLKYLLKEDSVSVHMAISAADSSLLQGKWIGPSNPSPDRLLFTIEAKPYLTLPFYQYVRKNQTPSTGSPVDRMKTMYNEYVKECLWAHEEEEIIRKNPDFAYLLNEYREGLLLFEIMETEVWSKASNDTTGQRAYFDANATSYQWKDRAEARVYSFDLASDRNAAMEALSRNDTLVSKGLSPQRGLFERGSNGAVDATPWTEGFHAVDMKGKFYVVHLTGVRSPAPKQFTEARASVISDYQDELEKRWVASLRSKYKVNVNGKTRKHVLSQLVKVS